MKNCLIIFAIALTGAALGQLRAATAADNDNAPIQAPATCGDARSQAEAEALGCLPSSDGPPPVRPSTRTYNPPPRQQGRETNLPPCPPNATPELAQALRCVYVPRDLYDRGPDGPFVPLP